MHHTAANFSASIFAYNFGYVFVELAEMYQAAADAPEAWDALIESLRDGAGVAMGAHRPEHSPRMVWVHDDRLS